MSSLELEIRVLQNVEISSVEQVDRAPLIGLSVETIETLSDLVGKAEDIINQPVAGGSLQVHHIHPVRLS